MSHTYTQLPLEPIAHYIFQQHVDFKSDFYDVENYKVRKRIDNKPQIQGLPGSEGGKEGTGKEHQGFSKAIVTFFLNWVMRREVFTLPYSSYLTYIFSIILNSWHLMKTTI